MIFKVAHRTRSRLFACKEWFDDLDITSAAICYTGLVCLTFFVILAILSLTIPFTLKSKKPINEADLVESVIKKSINLEPILHTSTTATEPDSSTNSPKITDHPIKLGQTVAPTPPPQCLYLDGGASQICRHSKPHFSYFMLTTRSNRTQCYLDVMNNASLYLHNLFMNCVLHLPSRDWNETCDQHRLPATPMWKGRQGQQGYSTWVVRGTRHNYIFIFESRDTPQGSRRQIANCLLIIHYKCVVYDLFYIENLIRFMLSAK